MTSRVKAASGIAAFVFGIAPFIAITITGCGRSPATTTAGSTPAGATAVVTRGLLEDRIALTGEVEATSSENLVVPRTPAWLLAVRWLADDGVSVKKGDRVVEFDGSSFSGTLEDKRTAVVRTEGELASEVAKGAGADADKALETARKRAALDKAKVEASVDHDLYPRRVFQEKQLALAKAKDELDKAEEDQRSTERAGRLERKVKQVAVMRARRELEELGDRLEELTLRAPRDGLVQVAVNRRENRKFLVGDQAFPGMPVATMPNLGSVVVRARLHDVDDGAVAEGMRADCVLDAYPKQVFRGAITQVSPIARQEGRETSRRFFDVLVQLEGAVPAFVKPGMSVRVDVLRRQVKDALIVPRTALRPSLSPGPRKGELRLGGGRSETVEVEWCTELQCVIRGGVLEGTALYSETATRKGAS